MSVIWNQQRIFVTGASGFIGARLVEHLRTLGAHVDVCEADLLRDKLSAGDYAKIDYIFHLAAIAPASSDKVDVEKIIADNIEMTKNVLEFADATKAKIILASSSHVYPPIPNLNGWKETEVKMGNAVSSYGLSKQKVEEYCIDYAKKNSLDLLIVRMSNVYGPGDKSNRFIPTFIRKCLEKKLPLEVLGESGVERDFLYVDDAVKGLTEAVEVVGYMDVINIGSGQKSTIGEMADMIKEMAGLAQEKIVYLTSKGSTVHSNILDVSLAKEVFGFETGVSLKEGLSRTVQWWKNLT